MHTTLSTAETLHLARAARRQAHALRREAMDRMLDAGAAAGLGAMRAVGRYACRVAGLCRLPLRQLEI